MSAPTRRSRIAPTASENGSDDATAPTRAAMIAEVTRLAPDGVDAVLAGAGISKIDMPRETVAINYFGAVATLEGLRPYPLTADSPEQLLERELGWHLPVAPLRDWLQGRPMDADTAIEHDAEGRVTGFEEQGWTITFRDFRDGRPTRISARKPPYQVRLAIKSWVGLP